MKLNRKFRREIVDPKILTPGEFKFKLHEKYPGALQFPMKLNLRKPPNGNITNELITKISIVYIELVRHNNLKYDLVAGLPNAADPLADAFIGNSDLDISQRIFLKKADLGFGKRKILPEIFGKHKKGNIVLAIDDVVTLGGSMGEAIEAFLLNDLYITHGVCLMYWGIGGKEIIKEKYGVKVIAAFTIEKLLSIAKDYGFVTSERHLDIIKIRNEIKEFIEQNEPVPLSA